MSVPPGLARLVARATLPPIRLADTGSALFADVAVESAAATPTGVPSASHAEVLPSRAASKAAASPGAPGAATIDADRARRRHGPAMPADPEGLITVAAVSANETSAGPTLSDIKQPSVSFGHPLGSGWNLPWEAPEPEAVGRSRAVALPAPSPQRAPDPFTGIAGESACTNSATNRETTQPSRNDAAPAAAGPRPSATASRSRTPGARKQHKQAVQLPEPAQSALSRFVAELERGEQVPPEPERVAPVQIGLIEVQVAQPAAPADPFAGCRALADGLTAHRGGGW